MFVICPHSADTQSDTKSQELESALRPIYCFKKMFAIFALIFLIFQFPAVGASGPSGLNVTTRSAAAASRRGRGPVTALNRLTEALAARVHLYRRRPAPRSAPRCTETGHSGPRGPHALWTASSSDGGRVQPPPRPMEVATVKARTSSAATALGPAVCLW